MMSKGKILVVDPDEDIRNLINAYLTQQGYEVVTAAEGKTATQNFRILPDVIVLENELPDMTGYEIRKRLRSIAHTNHIPIIFFVSREDPYDNTIHDLPPIVYEDYMTKPFDVEELRLRIQNAIKNSNHSKKG